MMTSSSPCSSAIDSNASRGRTSTRGSASVVAGDLVVLARDLDDLLVELEQVHPLDAGVLQHLGDEVHVAAADDRDVARVRVREQRRVRQHLVVHVRVEVGHLHDAVEGEHAAEARRLEQHDFLELGAALLEHLQDVVRGVRRGAGLVLLEAALGLLVGRDATRQVPAVDPLGLERVAQHADDRLEVGVVAAGEEVGGDVAVLGPGVDREMALGDHRDARHAVRRELVHEDVDERDVAGGGRIAQAPVPCARRS